MDLKSKNTEELKSYLLVTKIITYTLIGVLGLLLGISIYGLLTKEDNGTFIASIVVAISLGAFIPLNYITMKKIKRELKLRESND